jgi:hypothetical protein
MALQPFIGSWPLFSFLIFFTQSVGLLGRGISRSQKPLPTHRPAQTQNKRTQTSMPQVRFEPRISMLEQAKTGHTVDRATTVISCQILYDQKNLAIS